VPPNSSQLLLRTRKDDGTIITNATAAISWGAGSWHHVSFSYSPTATYLHVGGVFQHGVGTGLTNFSSPESRAYGFCVGKLERLD